MCVIKRTVADSYLTVNYTVTPTPYGPSGFALSGYGGNTSATFMPGVSELSVNLTLNGSGPLPGSAKMTLNPSSQYTIMGADSNTVAIYDVGGDSKWINVFRRVDPVGNTLNEGGDKGRFVVSRYFSYPTGQPPETIPTPPPFPDFALGGTARQGVDYTATKQGTTVVLPPLGSSMTFIDGYEVEIAPLADGVYDSGEWVDFALIPNEQSIVPSSNNGPISVTLPIFDAGTPSQTVISIVAPDPNASELTTSTGMYRIMRNDVNLPQSLTINYAFDPTGLTDPATFFDDYSATSKVGLSSSGSLTFPAGVAMIEVKLTPVDDSKLENDELAKLQLLPGSTYVVDALKSQALVLIVDKEEKPQIIITNKFVVEATKLKVAKWNDAFQMTTDGNNVEVKGPTAGTNYDFIDRDDDRFNIWVKDLTKWQKMEIDGITPSYLHNKVKISTTNVAGFTAYNDDATSVDLVRYTGGDKGNGWYWSDSQMLVSNEVDDKYSLGSYLKTDDTAPAGEGLLKNGFKWEVSDRTHRIALDGKTKAEYEYLPGKSVETEKTAKAVKNVKVHGIVLRETVNGAQVVSTAAATAAIVRANEQYAQVGIRLVPNVQVVDPPAGVDLSNGLEEFSSAPGGIVTMTEEEKALLGATELRTAATDDVELYFVNYLSDNSRGEAFPNSRVADHKYGDSAIVSAKNATLIGDPFTEAHEIGHVLLDTGHYSAALKQANLMVAYPSTTDTERASKRLTEGQETDALSKRHNLIDP